jgi:hypothetical protein
MTAQVITPAEALKEIERRREENIANNHWIMDLQEENAKLRVKAEAWEEMERLKASVSYGYVMETWYATVHRPEVIVAVGDTALEALQNLRLRIGEAAAKAEAASV